MSNIYFVCLNFTLSSYERLKLVFLGALLSKLTRITTSVLFGI